MKKKYPCLMRSRFKTLNKGLMMKLIFVVSIFYGVPRIAKSEAIADNSVSSDNYQNEKTISGTISDTNGDVIPGATVIVKGTTNGCITGIDGSYQLMKVSETDIVVFSFIGMVSQEIPVLGKTTIDVVLEDEMIGLDEVIAIGYGSLKKSDLTGSISSVSSKTIQEVPVTRVDQVLKSRVAGLTVQNNGGGVPGGETKIRIRGANSIMGNNDPLIVIDGFIGGSMNSVNPSDIESIEVLKDASATAIYGSRGANGVIIITTKVGSKDGKISVNYDGTTTIQTPSKKMDLLSAPEFANVVNEIRTANSLEPIYSSAEIEDFNTNGGTDWQDVLFADNALIHDHRLSVSGSSDKVKYLISGAFQDHEGILVHEDYNQKINLRSNINIQATEKLDFGLKVFTLRNKKVGADAWAMRAGNIRWAPTVPVYEEDGSYVENQLSRLPGATRTSNPLAELEGTQYEKISSDTYYNADINYQITNNFQFSYSIGSKFSIDRIRTYSNKDTDAGDLNNGIGEVSASESSFWISTAQLNYKKELNKHRLNVTAVFEEQGSKYSFMKAGSKDYAVDEIGFDNIGAGTTALFPNSSVRKTGLRSYVSRMNYVFDDKYLFTATFRADGSNKFTKENRWGYFPSGSFAWRASNEKFIEDLNVFYNLKLRASWGLTGNQGVPSGITVQKLSLTQGYPFNDEALGTAVLANSFANRDLQWEKTEQINFGLDMGFFKGRLSMAMDYYDKETTDLLMDIPLPWLVGYSSYTGNIGAVRNKGFELSINATPIERNFSWNTNVSVAVNRSEVLSLGKDDYITIPVSGWAGGSQIETLFRLEKGQPMGLFYGYLQDGTWGADEATEALAAGSVVGAPKYVNMDDNPEITPEDRTIIGNGSPDFTFGFTNTFKYKKLDLNAVIAGAVGGDIFNVNRIYMERSSNDGYPTGGNVRDRWTIDNQSTDIPAFGTSQYDYNQSSRYVEDGTYIKLTDLTLGYTLPYDFVNKIGLGSARLYIGGNNLITISSYSGYDPEINVKDQNAIGNADFSAYPSVRTFLFGANISF